MIPASADNPAIDSSSGLTEFTWSGTASTVELVGEWNWDEVTTPVSYTHLRAHETG